MRTDKASLLCHLLVVGDEHTAFAGGDVLVGEEAERSAVANGAEFLALVLRQRAVASILNHLEVMLLGNSLDCAFCWNLWCYG